MLNHNLAGHSFMYTANLFLMPFFAHQTDTEKQMTIKQTGYRIQVNQDSVCSRTRYFQF